MAELVKKEQLTSLLNMLICTAVQAQVKLKILLVMSFRLGWRLRRLWGLQWELQLGLQWGDP